MFGSSPAISGYYRQLNELRNGGYAKEETLMSNGDVDRVFTWTNLLKHLTLSTTPDVVAIWTIATAQANLLNTFIQPVSDNQRLTTIHYDYARPDNRCCELAEMSPYETLNATSTLMFPKEMYTMAHRYLKYRVSRFIDTIYSTVVSAAYGIRCGMMVRPHVLRSVVSYPYASEIGTAISNLKALNASIVPDAVYSGNENYNYNTTLYDPSKYIRSAERQRLESIDTRFIVGLRRIIDNLSLLHAALNSAVVSNDIGSFNMHKEAFCLAAETLLAIIESLTRTSSYHSALHKPDFHYLYQYAFTEDAESSGRSVDQTEQLKMANDDGCGSRVPGIAFQLLKRLSPAAALCLNDTLMAGYERVGYCAEWTMDIINRSCPRHANWDVLGFIIGEYVWSSSTSNQVKSIILKQRSEDKSGR